MMLVWLDIVSSLNGSDVFIELTKIDGLVWVLDNRFSGVFVLFFPLGEFLLLLFLSFQFLLLDSGLSDSFFLSSNLSFLGVLLDLHLMLNLKSSLVDLHVPGFRVVSIEIVSNLNSNVISVVLMRNDSRLKLNL